MNQLTTLILMAPAQQGGGGGNMQFLLMMGLVFIVFYFFMIRPQATKAKNERKFREEIKKGDKVVTIGGVHGKITDVAETTFMLEVDNNVRMKIEKSSVSVEASKQYATEVVK